MPIGKVLVASAAKSLSNPEKLQELGIGTVAVYSTVDRNALHVQLADEAVCVGEASNRGYLNVPNILAAAHRGRCHPPGYGFLAENDKFAEMCRDHGLTFVGPHAAIRSMGDKSTAKRPCSRSAFPPFPAAGALANP